MTTWQEILRTNIRSTHELCEYLKLHPSQYKLVMDAKPFGLNVPRRLAMKMEKGNVHDPLFLQFVSQVRELEQNSCFIEDPVHDRSFKKSDKLLVKYKGRALIITTGVCAMHCRYCFRQNFVYPTLKGFQKELSLIAADTTIKEVILSGGDPLSLSNRILEDLITQIEAIPHIIRLRFHSRFPIGIPERIDEGFLSILCKSPLQIYFVIHCNHPKELDDEVLAALKKMQKTGITILNQAVLLRGVNDDVDTLEALVEACIDNGILPYYLHQLDRVKGAMHFEVERERGKELIAALRERTSGFGQFRYVEEIPHEKSKTIV